MKTLTLTQPWASLVAMGQKKIETRSWRTNYKGPLLIHAAKGYPKSAQRMMNNPIFYEAFRFGKAIELWPEPGLPLGAIIATCELIQCVRTSAVELWPDPISETERTFGDYSDGRWAWLLGNIKPLPKPIPAKGALGLWEYPMELSI
jgi:activating signal cointegrator 1